MKNNIDYYFASFTTPQRALDFGICNGFVYMIRAAGEILVNRLAASVNQVFKLISEKNIESIYRNKDFIPIANLHSFPLDSITYKNILAVFTEDGTSILNLSLHPEKIRIYRNEGFKPISAVRSNRLYMYSFGEEGFVVTKTNNPQNKFVKIHDPSTQILVSKDTIVNLYPDDCPKIYRINSSKYIENKKTESSYEFPEIIPLEDINRYFAENEILGRDIIAPFSVPDRIFLPTVEKEILSIDTSVKSNETSKIDISAYDNILRLESKLSYLDFKSMNEDNNPNSYEKQEENMNVVELPISYHYHPEGIVEKYWDRVEFAGFNGKRFKIVEDEEIAEVRTYPNNPRYSALITIATEKACHLVHIPIRRHTDYENVISMDPIMVEDQSRSKKIGQY